MSPGARNQAPFALGIQRVGTLICYEDLTGQEVRRWLPSATLLLNPSNLAWFEGGLAIGQRLQIIRMRALESGRPILRVTNTGFTAQIDAHGSILGRLPVSVEGVLSGTIQRQQGVTPYGRGVIGLPFWQARCAYCLRVISSAGAGRSMPYSG